MTRSRGNGIIRGRRAPMIQNCPTCGMMRFWHPGRRLYECPVPKEVTLAIRAFRDANGVRWKSRLVRLWASDDAMPILLFRAKGLIGPRRIYKIKP